MDKVLPSLAFGNFKFNPSPLCSGDLQLSSHAMHQWPFPSPKTDRACASGFTSDLCFWIICYVYIHVHKWNGENENENNNVRRKSHIDRNHHLYHRHLLWQSLFLQNSTTNNSMFNFAISQWIFYILYCKQLPKKSVGLILNKVISPNLLLYQCFETQRAFSHRRYTYYIYRVGQK